ncbi:MULTISPECIES: hypothetical protein [unclassified Pseudoxanthomonas]|uniref:hypothetical protein n=1 Tax=unclassified Pseudoxanthomonas TaxID=2645906 RepID=UPI00160D4F5C|nr:MULTISPECIES: hypothetical protein [unclassified Pseudoxanthomonas]MBB3276766.1 hypothetical protein [Pseudoxanthomonas sp. OG2]MBD9378830.1 hypothetical protein [Pseudoxanthomonas sp. PXM04]MBV7472161.1 hypothetical protein [Pseudoxanthomonas sp. PXM05]
MTAIEVIAVVLGNTAVIGILGTAAAYVTKSVFNNYLTSRLDVHRANLEQQASAARARLEHELRLVAQEHQISFAGLHARRAEVIAELYRLLAETHWDNAASFNSRAYQ